MPAQNPNANRSESVKPKPARKVKAKVKAPAAKQVTQARAQEQQYASQAHSVRAQASPKRGTSPSGDRPQGRSQAMDRTPSHRAMPKDPNTGREISTLKTPEAPRGSQQRGTSPSGDRPQGRAKEMRDAPTVKVKKGHGPGTVLATLSPATLAGKYVAAVNWKDPRGTISGGADIATNAAMDAAELGVTTPTSLIKLGDTAIHHPKKVPGMLVEPYKQLIKDPKTAISEHPVSTALMLQPAVRMPGRAVGKVARATGKQTLERPTATLPGTALKEKRTGSRDVVVRAVQSRGDKKTPAPAMTAKEVQRRVDEFHDVAKQHAGHAEAEAVRAARKRVKGRPKQERREAVTQARERAREDVRHENDARFAHEFGATGRLSTTAAEREMTGRVRRDAEASLKQAKGRVQTTEAAHGEALTGVIGARARARKLRVATLERQRAEAQRDLARARQAHASSRKAVDRVVATGRAAAAKGGRSARLDAMVMQHQRVTRDLAAAERAHSDAMAEFGVARGRGQVLSRNVAGEAGERRATSPTVPAGSARGSGVGTQYAGGGHGVQAAAGKLQEASRRVTDLRSRRKTLEDSITAERKRLRAIPSGHRRAIIAAKAERDATPEQMRAARDRVRELDKRISDEHKRIVDVFSPEHQTLFDAMHARNTARSDLTAARALAEQTRSQHIGTKTAMRDATLVHPTAVGRVFSHKADARGVMRKLNEQHGEDTFTLLNVGDGYAAVPKIAVERLAKHRAVGSSKATGAKVMRVTRQQFTQAVLPLSLKWLAGQGGEAGLRAVVAGAGPMDLLRMNKVVSKLNKERPGAGDELLMRVSGGQFGLTGTAREFAGGKSLAEEFADTGLQRPAEALTRAGQTAPARAVRTGWSKYSSAVFDTINGAIENNARKAMAGHALKHGPLMERHLLGLTDKALNDAARGLRGSEAQVQLGRAADRMYGKYQKFSPEMRSMLLHWTPFMPWYLNVATFLFKVLPVDHPVKTALIADVSMATEDWRKEHRLSLRSDDRVKDFLLGSYPASGNRFYRVSKYTPFGVGADPLGASADLLLPQFLGPLKNAGGVDYKWQRLKHPGYAGSEFNLGERGVRAVLTGAESQVPGVSQAARISGVEPKLVDKKSEVPGVVESLKRELPTTPTKGASPSQRTGAVVGRVKVPGGVTGRVKVPGGGTGRVKVPGG